MAKAAQQSQQSQQERPAVSVVAVPLGGGFTWQQRFSPEPRLFARWRRALVALAAEPEKPLHRVRERMALIAAYDGGWDVRDATGTPVPPPRDLNLRGWNRVPREVIVALLDHIDNEASIGITAAGASGDTGDTGDTGDAGTAPAGVSPKPPAPRPLAAAAVAEHEQEQEAA